VIKYIKGADYCMGAPVKEDKRNKFCIGINIRVM
jgi:hypothetical protein